VLFSYLFNAVGLSRIAEHRGFGKISVLAWIPVLSSWLKGCVAADVFGVGRGLGTWYAIASVGWIVFFHIPAVGVLGIYLYLVFYVSVNFLIIRYKYEPVVSFLLAVIAPVGIWMAGRRVICE
jgi:hypothetical protein